MKAKSTIQAQIRRLRRIAENDDVDEYLRHRCYEAYHALRWVIEDTTWTPAGLAESELTNASKPRLWAVEIPRVTTLQEYHGEVFKLSDKWGIATDQELPEIDSQVLVNGRLAVVVSHEMHLTNPTRPTGAFAFRRVI
jgi:hypothetical protein